MIKSFLKFNEMYSFDKEIKVRINIDDSKHSVERQNRSDNEADVNGNKVVSSEEIKADIIKSLDQLLLLNLYSSKVFWNGDKLNKNILVKNKYTNLNIVYAVSKKKQKNEYIYSIDIVTVMRKTDFGTDKNSTFEIILN
jgi:hypothetical protein